ncbi:MAG: 4-hydroxythreonine-4-phosphate dehydrogenase PdxA [Candidatus Azobacteroides sp.]|nr:4-hydroxythreonine-4-phosphate dehydrogenase PdxA [Candidatus Azobacteroides sp.]
MNEILKIGISQGDTNSIAYELILKAFEDARMYESCIPVIYGSSKALAYHRKTLELPSLNINNIHRLEEAAPNRINMYNVVHEEVMVELGKSTADSLKAAETALAKGWEDLQTGQINILLAAPSTADIAAKIDEGADNERKSLKILIKEGLRIALATDKIPLAEVPFALTTDQLAEKIITLQASMIQDFMINSSRIAVLSLNPQSGIKEKLGKEELEIIIPAIHKASEEGVVCFGPYSADDFFGSDEYRRFDAILAMYYDQGATAFQSITAGEGAIYYAGSPYIVVSPYIGVSYHNAGKNKTLPDSFRESFYLAADIYRNREIDKEINKNPLKKQYFERGSDNEKLDLTKDEV